MLTNNSDVFAVFDVEMANNTDKGAICSIGVVLIDGGKVVDSFYSLVNPKAEFNPICSRIHGIKAQHVEDAPTFGQLWPTLQQYFSCGTLVAFRAESDIYPLEKALHDAGIPVPLLRYACAYRISKKLLDLESYKLSAVAQHLSIVQENAHNALDDALVTAQIVLRLMDMSKASTLNQLMRTACLLYDDTLSNNYDPVCDCCTKPEYTPPAPLTHGSSQYFQGKSVVLTGTLLCASRESIRMTIESMGGICKTNTSRKTDIVIFGFYDQDTLVSGAKVGRKLQNAYDLIEAGYEIIIMDENELLEIIRQ